MKTLIKKFIPKSVLRAYHKIMAKTADFWYGHPSGKMIVIGVTGTKGKSTTCYMLAKILEEAGYKVGMTSTAMFKIDKKEWLNPDKMTMLGRLKLQKMLKQMVDVGCQYAVVETSSEGIAQWRHAGIEYDVALMTNLAPEHLETHGGFDKYREAKGQLFQKLKIKNVKLKIIEGKPIKKVIIVNGDDEAAEYFLQFPADEKYIYNLKSQISNLKTTTQNLKLKKLLAEKVELKSDGVNFYIDDTQFNLKLLGRFNVYNALAAIAAAMSQGIDLPTCQRAIEKIISIPGRLEPIEQGQPFKVFVDYAHNPSSFEALYEAIAVVPHNRIIHVFGATGGGRDKSKRPEMGRIAAEHADVIIITTDDPYEENQQQIAEMVFEGAAKVKSQNSKIILDRREAIKEAINQARSGDVVLITGKGCEQKMAIGGKMIPWDDREMVREELKLRIKNTELRV
ncbi:MAG: UDP-N-acetylmuramoyl-L-alanyl-D-glutamate--2,6-diaminopimelate ligase [bacterium]|nr:UDP-N-acetylmuramoyl-L-alanyl-D-glutamate--2,6-diaminopimelate ligase [bacterium]